VQRLLRVNPEVFGFFAYDIDVGGGDRGNITIFGFTYGTVVSSGGEEIVEYQGVASGTIVTSGGEEIVEYRGVASGTIVGRGGSEIVEGDGYTYLPEVGYFTSSFGTANGTIVSSGGYEIVSGGYTSDNGVTVYGSGVTNGTIVSRGGYEIVSSGGVASGTVVSRGGHELVGPGGVTSGTVVYRGGAEVVQNGGVANGTFIDGGRLEIQGGGSTSAVATRFATSGGILQLDSSLTFGGLVAGFGKPDQLDLRDIAFISGTTHPTWTQSGTTGTLAVTDGTHTADITLLGQYVAGNFHVRTDNHGGTIVTDPPVKTATDVQNVALVNPHQT
jgi:autotransporter passenger strand-loop-strand repeat protein